MANGDAAAAAGMDILNPLTDKVMNGADEINKTRDYIADRTSAVLPVAEGGTGATTAAAARTNLGVPAAASTPSKSGPNQIDIRWASPRVVVKVDATDFQMATGPEVATLSTRIDAVNNRVDGKRDTNNGSFAVTVVTSGDLGAAGRLQAVGSRAFTVSSSWAAAALDGAGYLGIQPSAERFKQDVKTRVYSLAEAAEIGRLVVEYRLVDAVSALGESAAIEVGIIAERLLEAGFPEFVVFDTGGVVLSIHYAQLVTVALSALVEVASTLDDFAARLAALETP